MPCSPGRRTGEQDPRRRGPACQAGPGKDDDHLDDEHLGSSTRRARRATTPLRCEPCGFLIRLYPLEVRVIARNAAELAEIAPLGQLLEHVLCAAIRRGAAGTA